MPGMRLDQRQLEHRLRVVGHRAVGVDRDRHRAHAEEAERDEAEREDRRRQHQRRRGPSVLIEVGRRPSATRCSGPASRR